MNRSRHIRMKLLLVAGDRTTNNARSVVSISGGLGRPFNHGLRGAQPLYHHWTVSRANCGYISLSPWPAHRNDLLVCCRRSTDTQHGGRGEVRELGKYVIAYKWEKMHKGLKWSLKKKKRRWSYLYCNVLYGKFSTLYNRVKSYSPICCFFFNVYFYMFSLSTRQTQQLG